MYIIFIWITFVGNQLCFIFAIMKKLLFIGIIASIFCLSSCGPTRFVEPLQRNENALAVDLGGPLVKIPGMATIPLPFTAITYGRGITDKLTLHGTWYTTAAFLGDIQLEAGATYGLWKSKYGNNGVSGMIGFNTVMDVYQKNFRFWPRLDVHYYWKYNYRATRQSDMFGKGKPVPERLYVGIGSWYELSKELAHGNQRKRFVVPMLNIGHDLNWKKWTFKAELRLIAPLASNQNLVLDYISITGKTGATGVYIGFIRRF